MTKKSFTLEEALAEAARRAGAGELDLAENYYRAIIAQAPSTAEAPDGLKSVLACKLDNLARAGKHPETEACARALLALDPAHGVATKVLGVALLQQRKSAEATAVYTELLTRHPDDLDARSNLGSALLQQERYADALAHFQAVVARAPQHVSAIHNLGKALLALGEPAAATPHLFKAAALQPESYSFAWALIQATIETGDVATADAWAEAQGLPTLRNFGRDGRFGKLANLLSLFMHFQKVQDTEERYEKYCVPAMEIAYRAVSSNAALRPTERWRTRPAAGKRKVAFFAETVTNLAHTRNLFNYTSALAARADLGVQPVLYFAEAQSVELIEQYERAGIPAYQIPRIKATEEVGFWLRRHLQENGIDTWVTLGTVSSLFLLFLAMRVAPVQIWWSQKYHALRLPNIDGYLTLGGFEPTRELKGRTWRCIPGLFGPEIVAPATEAEMAEVANIRRSLLQTPATLIAGVIGREEKIDNDAYWDCIAEILGKHPEIVFLWSGQSERQTIKERIAARGLADRCRFVGWVNTKIYANAIDIYLDSFPFPGGHTLIQAMVAGKPAVSLLTKEARRIGIPIFAEPWLKDDGGETLRRHNLDPIFTGQGGENLLPFLPEPSAYVAKALALIEDRAFRERWVRAGQQFVVRYLTDLKRPADMLNSHILDVFREREQDLGEA